MSAPAEREPSLKHKWHNARMYAWKEVVVKWWFEAFILLCIIVNCVFMAMSTPAVEAADGATWKVIETAESVFAWIFFTEMAIKWFALGFIGKGQEEARHPKPDGYFTDNWNWLDFVVVVVSMVSEFSTNSGASGLKALRVLRVLKGLRAVKSIPAMRIIVTTLMSSMSGLVDVVVLLMFLFVIYGIIGVQMFSGKLRYRCWEVDADGIVVQLPKEALADEDEDCFHFLGEPTGECTFETTLVDQNFEDDELATCNAIMGIKNSDQVDHKFGLECPADCTAITDRWECVDLCTWDGDAETCGTLNGVGIGYTCSNYDLADVTKGEIDNPDAGLSSFDSLPEAFISIFYVVSLDNWSFIMYKTMDASWTSAWIFYLSLIFLVSFFGINLVLAVISDEFGDAADEVREEQKNDEAERLEGSIGASEFALRAHVPRSMDKEYDIIQDVSKHLDHVRTQQIVAVQEPWVSWMDEQMQIAALVQLAQRKFREDVLFYRQGNAINILMFDIVEHSVFQAVIMILIILNTVVLAMEHHGMPQSLSDVLEVINYILTGLFTMEMIMKIIGFGFAGYIKDAFNVFDGVIVMTSLMDVVVTVFASGANLPTDAISVFRICRLLRVFKMVKRIKSLRRLMTTVLESLNNIFWMTLLLFLFIFCFAILGMQLFPDVDGFDGFKSACINIFVVLTGDAWTDMMFGAVGVVENYTPVVFYFAVVITGAYIIMNLFVAILLENFENQDETENGFNDKMEFCFNLFRAGFTQEQVEAKMKALFDKQVAEFEAKKKRATMDQDRANRAKVKRSTMGNDNPDFVIPEGVAFGYLPPEHWMRQLCVSIINNEYFEPCVIAAIVINCGFLAFENPSNTPGQQDVFAVVDVFFAAVFAIEMGLKLISLGCWGSPSAYFRSGWNQIDGAVVIISLVTLFAPSLGMLRAFRAVRPIRIVARMDNIRVVIESLIEAIPAIGNVTVFCLFFYLIFGIMGVNMFSGKFYRCQPEGYEYLDKAECIGIDEESGGELRWINPAWGSFDDVWSAMAVLFQVATMSAWADIMAEAEWATEHELRPREGENPVFPTIFFIGFIIICSFGAMNLFVGVVIDNFQRLKAEKEGSAFMTREQQQWVNQRKLISRIPLTRRYIPPSNWLRKMCLRIVENDLFDITIMAVILLNTVIMMTTYYNQPEGLTTFQSVMNYIFVVIFAIEAVLKIAAYTWPIYWSVAWNKFDFVIVILSFVPIVIMIFGLEINAGISVIRVFRVARVFKLVKSAKNLQKLFQTLIYSLPSLLNIGFLLYVVFFIFAILGVALFGDIPLNDSGLARHANFHNHGNALLSLFRVATGDAWEELREGTSVDKDSDPDCEDNRTCGSALLSTVFFLAFTIVGAAVMLELFLAVILENFGNADEEQEYADLMEQMCLWRDVWEVYDPLSSGHVPVFAFEDLMTEAPKPFGLGGPHGRWQLLKFFRKINVPIHLVHLPKRDMMLRNTMITRSKASSRWSANHSNVRFDEELFKKMEVGEPKNTKVYCVNFHECLMTLAKQVSHINVDTDFDRDDEMFMLHEWYAVKQIQDLWRARATRQKRTSDLESRLNIQGRMRTP